LRDYNRQCPFIPRVDLLPSILLLSILAFSLRGVRGQELTGAPSSHSREYRDKIAEGEYLIVEEGNGGAIGPFGEETYNFRETWTLWRLKGGRYEVEGERRFESPRDVHHSNRFLVELSRDLTMTRATEYTKLKWRKDSGPLSCEFLPRELHCSSGAQDPKQAVELRMPMEHPFGLLWPISVFSLAGVSRYVERDLNREIPIELVTLEQSNATYPVSPTILSGSLRYLGEEDLETATQKFQAYKFLFRVPSKPQFLIWTSSKGILLRLAVEHAHEDWPQEGIRLTRFQRWVEF